MIEVFKTNVMEANDATHIISLFNNLYGEYKVNFDLDDCDKILRIQSSTKEIQTIEIIELLRNEGFAAEILVDIT